MTTDRVIANRTTNGVEVTLEETEDNGALTVRVRDKLSGGYFEMHPQPNEAIMAFHYPYAFRSLSLARYRAA